MSRVPNILYFPTFLFSHPEKIILNPGPQETPVNRIYREIIQDILSALDRPLDVNTHLVNRILRDESVVDKAMTLVALKADKQQQIDAVLDEMSEHVTDTVFDSWAKIFGGNFSGREIIFRVGIEIDKDSERRVYIQFLLKDGKSTYEISERSLGFRWFFSFLLFTIYRVSSIGRGPILFLLDEPASNLHARAQMQLIESFPKIATGNHQIIYSTHSHYMINPEWLDQAFIVSNDAIDYGMVDGGEKSIKSRPTNVKVEKYRSFVGNNPDKMTYFQPVLDKLDVAPSRLDLMKPSVLVEGKGDYLAIEYGRRVVSGAESNVSVVPTRGAAGMNELIGLFLGWGVDFAICLDDDKAGRDAMKNYIEEWGLSEERVFTLSRISESLSGKRIEHLIDSSDRDMISKYFGIENSPTKSQVQLFFSENLAKKNRIKMSDEYVNYIRNFEEVIEKVFGG